jgi:hypothetical protein
MGPHGSDPERGSFDTTSPPSRPRPAAGRLGCHTAIYVPADYSREAFDAKRLDYGLHLSPIELWGRREDVLATVARHNEIVRGLASRHDGVLFVDQASLMGGSARYFNDPCHLTVEGSARFAEHLVPVVLPTFPSR